MEKKLEENLLLKLKLASTEVDLERTRLELFKRETETSKTKLATLQKNLQAFIEDIKSGLTEQGLELTGIDLERGTVTVEEMDFEASDNSEEPERTENPESD